MNKLYDELAPWWPLFSPTSDYEEEANFFAKLFQEAGAKSILELGAGGGNIAWYFKKHFQVTITDLSPEMLKISKKQNPDCEHIAGDMRTLRLNQKFDGVFIHDAIMYMLTEADLLQAFQTAYEHLKPGGLLVVAPDCTLENFRTGTEYEGHDAAAPSQKAVRYIQWVTDPDPTDNQFNYDFIIALRDGEKLETIVDRQHCGVFPRQTWHNLLEQAGFTAKVIQDETAASVPHERSEIFYAQKNH